MDAEALARIGLMAPEALRPVRLDPKYQSLGRWVRRHYRRNRALGELKRSFWSLVEELLPGVGRVIDDPLSVAGRAFFRRYANPFAVLRLGSRRFTQAMERAAGQYGKPETIAGLYALCERAVELHRQAARGLDFEDLAEEVAFALEEMEEAAERLTRVRRRLEALVGELDPEGILTSIPGIGLATAAACLAALGSHDFRSVKAFRAYTGLVPRVAASGQTLGRGLPLTKSGPAWLRTALFLAAESARRWDPELARVYHRAMVAKGHPTARRCAPWRRALPTGSGPSGGISGRM